MTNYPFCIKTILRYNHCTLMNSFLLFFLYNTNLLLSSLVATLKTVILHVYEENVSLTDDIVSKVTWIFLKIAIIYTYVQLNNTNFDSLVMLDWISKRKNRRFQL